MTEYVKVEDMPGTNQSRDADLNNDGLTGAAHAEKLVGGASSDVLPPGAGNDVISSGNTPFRFSAQTRKYLAQHDTHQPKPEKTAGKPDYLNDIRNRSRPGYRGK